MVEPKFRWRVEPALTVDPACLAAASAAGASERLARLLAARGIVAPADVAAFFAPPEAGLHDPALLPDAEVALRRVALARARGERVLVFGDFDADGLTGLAIVVIALRRLGLAAQPYVPARLDEGHGLSLRALDAATEAGITLIVTADCGTSSGPEIEAAARRGIDVIVTDHHHAATWPAAAVAVVNPHRPDSAYADRRLTGAGVAWKFASLLLGELGAGGADSRTALVALDLADLALIGTVADVAPIVGENRSIARLGLERLHTAPRPGLAALLEQASIAPRAVDLEDIGFAIAPRLNAAGRVGEASRAAQLLLTEDPAEAAGLAAEIDSANNARRDLTKTVLGEAQEALPPAVPGEDRELGAAILVQGDWPVGIVGLVAGRLADEHGRPAVVATLVDPEAGLLRASCRSPRGFDLAAALVECKDLLVRHGGHAAAAGFEIELGHWPEFEARFLGLAAAARLPSGPRELLLDLVLPARALDYALLADLARLEPTGPGNPPALVALTGLTVVRTRAANGGHTQLVLRRERDVLDAIAFRRPDLVALAEGERVDVVARPASRAYGGFESMQLEIRDVATAGSQAGLLSAAAAAAAEPSAVAASGIATAPAAPSSR